MLIISFICRLLLAIVHLAIRSATVYRKWLRDPLRKKNRWPTRFSVILVSTYSAFPGGLRKLSCRITDKNADLQMTERQPLNRECILDPSSNDPTGIFKIISNSQQTYLHQHTPPISHFHDVDNMVPHPSIQLSKLKGTPPALTIRRRVLSSFTFRKVATYVGVTPLCRNG